MRLSQRAVGGVLVAAGVLAGASACTATDAPRPVVTSVQVPEQTAYASDVSACMNARGWNTMATYDNGLTQTSMIKTEDIDAFDADVVTCEATLDYQLEPEMTDELIGEYYEVERAARQCLMQQGYPTPPMPSVKEYTGSFGTAEMYDLTSLVVIDDVSRAENVFGECRPAQWFPPKVPK